MPPIRPPRDLSSGLAPLAESGVVTPLPEWLLPGTAVRVPARDRLLMELRDRANALAAHGMHARAEIWREARQVAEEILTADPGAVDFDPTR